MAEFSVRADHINVEQIMRQIRARMREKRGADYTEEEIRELASVKLDRFLDPLAVRSGLLQHYRSERQPTPLITPDEAHRLSGTSTRDGVRLRSRRGRQDPDEHPEDAQAVLEAVFQVDTLMHVLNMQSVLNGYYTALFQRVHSGDHLQQRDALNFEMFNNLVVELTRLGIENRNLRMRVESLSTRLDFAERRARALEGVVQYRPGAPVARPPQPPQPSQPSQPSQPRRRAATMTRRRRWRHRSARRRRRRRGRRRGR